VRTRHPLSSAPLLKSPLSSCMRARDHGPDCLLTSAHPLDRSQLHPFKAVGADAARGELAVSRGVPARRGGCAPAPPPRGMTTGERGGAVKELDDDSSGGRRTTSRV